MAVPQDNLSLDSGDQAGGERDLASAFGLAELPAEPPPYPSPRPSVDALIADMVALLVTRFKPLAIILFGSRARGDEQPSSDVDLLVVLPHGMDKRAMTGAIRQHLSIVPIAKDIIVTTPQDIVDQGSLTGSILYPALQQGKVLYDVRDQSA